MTTSWFFSAFDFFLRGSLSQSLAYWDMFCDITSCLAGRVMFLCLMCRSLAIFSVVGLWLLLKRSRTSNDGLWALGCTFWHLFSFWYCLSLALLEAWSSRQVFWGFACFCIRNIVFVVSVVGCCDIRCGFGNFFSLACPCFIIWFENPLPIFWTNVCCLSYCLQVV